MIVSKDFNSLIEMNKYIQDNDIKSESITYMGDFLNIHNFCLAAMWKVPKYTLQYENGIKQEVSCCDFGVVPDGEW